MKKFLLPLSIALLLPVAAAAGDSSSCGNSAEADSPIAENAWSEVSVAELASMLEEGAAVAVDANRSQTRQDVGIIPGAILLEGSEYETDVLASAGSDDALVFYCYNERCGASHQAADLALAAGYADVRVLPAGIMGWVEAGQEVDSPSNN
ncbi:MAG: rhodanese-related sulfurtransferase [Bradymonadia bacterium]|jgi:rhodanese-related sulfurtransferase